MVGGVAFGDMLGVGFQHVLDVGIAVFFVALFYSVASLQWQLPHSCRIVLGMWP